MRKILELLAPAKNIECGIAAINHGADAVYIGAPKFGARAMAGNSITDIEQLIKYAHSFGVKIYATLNTILFDNELDDAEKLIHQLYEIGTDALIIQDLGILQLHLPPIALHASTQTDNRTPEKVTFLHECGFSRVVLARETPLETIRQIHEKCPVELEVFVHGALCVSYSGQCYMSQASCGRSANRGVCAQYCRLPYSLQDADGKILLKEKHLLSLKDMNRSVQLTELIEAGVTSFKIEGRLKDINYVKNITAFYRQKMDAVLEKDHNHTHSSVGTSTFFFAPNPDKSFHRGNTDYFLRTRSSGMAQFNTPKSMGEEIGTVKSIGKNSFSIDTKKTLHNGDGICFLNTQGEFSGFRVNRVEGNNIFPAEKANITIGNILYRNFDHEFEKELQRKSAERKIGITATLSESENGFLLQMTDEEGISVTHAYNCEKQPATKTELAENTIRTQLSKLGDTIFKTEKIEIITSKPYFIISSQLSEWRKETASSLLKKRVEVHRPKDFIRKDSLPQTPKTTLYLDNIANRKAVEFYNIHGSRNIANAFELTTATDAILMQCKYCIKYELGWCPKQKKQTPAFKEPLSLNYKGQRYTLNFNCTKCEMIVKMASLK